MSVQDVVLAGFGSGSTIQLIVLAGFEGGEAEVTLAVQLEGVWARVRLDYLQDFAVDLTDYKSTGASAHEDFWTFRQMRPMGFMFKMAFYRAITREAIRLGIIEGDHSLNCVFVVQENFAPYLLKCIAIEDDWLNVLEQKYVPRALRVWRECNASGIWPGYSTDLAFAKQTEREMMADGLIKVPAGETYNPHGMGWSENLPDSEYSGITFKKGKP